MEAGFITYDMLVEWVSFVAIVFMVTQFVKNTRWLANVDNKWIAFIVAFVLLLISNLVNGTFRIVDIVVYLLSSILVTTQSSGIYDAGKLINTKESEETKNESV